jgi:hypothetical protein
VHLESEAEKEVALAMQMPLRDKSHQQTFFAQRDLLGTLREECELFESRGLKILPTDVVSVLFRCKLLFASASEQEFRQRGGDQFPFQRPPKIEWSQRSNKIETVAEQSFDDLEKDQRQRILITQLTSYVSAAPDDEASIQQFLEELFKSLSPSLHAFIAPDKLVERHQTSEPWPANPGADAAAEFFQTPSIGYSTQGSRAYCWWTSMHWLRSFLNLLRIGSFIHPGQIQFGGWENKVKVTAPTNPVFLEDHSIGHSVWDQDKKESWAKVPDGSLFLSFGYRGISPMWLDRRTFSNLTGFVVANKVVFDCLLKNAWSIASTNDVAPALDLLSSAVQIPDLGAKILLIYTCLEHLFVPKGIKSNQKLYVLGGLKALKPSLVAWFDSLYKLRCDYAHRGFVIRDEGTMSSVMESVKNVMILLAAKLSVA